MGEFIDTSIKYSEIDNSELFADCCINQNNIYHYTSMSGLKGIVENESLWFTDIKYMNDMEEVKAGIDHAHEIVERMPEDFKAKGKDALNHILDGEGRTFIACFSLDNDSLGLWNYYTKDINNSGINLSFDFKKLVKTILIKNEVLDGCILSCGIVDYSTQFKNSYVERSVKNLEAFFLNFFRKNIPYVDVPVLIYDGIKKCFCYQPLKEIFFYVKRCCFRHENEFRIVITVPKNKSEKIIKSGIYKFREGNGVLIPYLDIKFDLTSINGITIAPTLKSDLIDRSLKDFFEYKGIDSNQLTEGVKRSVIPIRF